jgi:tRNA-splicing ligase RtcB (3'-phosphate/5'-hydroxy nucleic acid ligase)
MPIAKNQLQRLDCYRWLVPRATKPGMHTDALVYADEHLLEQILGDLSIEQTMNVACLPGIVGRSLAMPDIHQGYGFPIGGVAATDANSGVISPGGVGFDINCGVRLLASNLERDAVTPKLRDLVNQVFRDVPSGTGSTGPVRSDFKQLEDVLERGAAAIVERGFGDPADLEFCEESGTMRGANAGKVSDRAKQRGRTQIGTLGSGNHFLEVQYVERIFEPEIAKIFGLERNQVVVLIHCGSRGLGHQVCTDFLKVMNEAMPRYSISLPDRQLACVPLRSPEAKDYLAAMAASANYAWANRQAITHFTRGAFRRILGHGVSLHVVYDVAHNIAKRERHHIFWERQGFNPGAREALSNSQQVQERGGTRPERSLGSPALEDTKSEGSPGNLSGEPHHAEESTSLGTRTALAPEAVRLRHVIVHRKGATRSFPAGSPELPAAYKNTGQPVLIPGSMGTASYVLVGTDRAMQETFGTVCHGAGRAMSRTAAKRGRDARVETKKLEDQGIILRAETRDGILEEIPEAYKDIDEVIDVVQNAGLARKVARLRPMGVIKG